MCIWSHPREPDRIGKPQRFRLIPFATYFMAGLGATFQIPSVCRPTCYHFETPTHPYLGKPLTILQGEPSSLPRLLLIMKLNTKHKRDIIFSASRWDLMIVNSQTCLSLQFVSNIQLCPWRTMLNGVKIVQSGDWNVSNNFFRNI